MKSIWLYPFIILAGILQAAGVSMNAQLRNSLLNPWLASIVSFAPILIFFIAATSIMPKPWPTLQDLTSYAMVGTTGWISRSSCRVCRPDTG